MEEVVVVPVSYSKDGTVEHRGRYLTFRSFLPNLTSADPVYGPRSEVSSEPSTGDQNWYSSTLSFISLRFLCVTDMGRERSERRTTVLIKGS